MILRDYQTAAVDALFDYWQKAFGNPVEALPTGTGKSVVIAEFCRRALTLYPSTKIVIATHVKELVSQNFEKLLEIWPTAPAGVYSAGLGRKDVGRQITFVGIGSIARAVNLFNPDIVLIDECHTVSPKETTTYRKVIAFWQAKNPFLKVAGFTATPYRLGQGMIVEPGGIFSDICFDLTGKEAFNWFISEGYLAPLVPPGVHLQTEIDISSVHLDSTGDFKLNELQAAVDKDSITRAAVAETIRLGAGRDHWLVFAAGIQHAEHVAAVLVEMGISAVCVHSKSGEEVRDEAVKMFKAGQVQALVNNGVFTTGFDFPGIDLIVVLRHTTSPGLWVQMLGRGTRPLWFPGFDLSKREGRLACIAAGKPNCLVLDFARNASRLGPINDVKKPQAKKKQETPGDAPAKICEACWAFNHASARTCCECGTEFKFQIKFNKGAATDELIAGVAVAEEPISEWFDVARVEYSRHVPWNGRKPGRFGGPPASLRVSYDCGLRKFVEYVCLEHEGHALASAHQWWKEAIQSEKAYASEPVPDSVSNALQQAAFLRQPARIRVWINRKNPQVLYREFTS